jgi:NhaP-type Na+/H+ or K+/H+ antiporter
VHIDITIAWFLIVGALLISMGLMESLLQRLPLSPAMFYLPIGYFLGPAGIGLIEIDLHRDAHLLTQITEIALLISLFTVGLMLRVSISDSIWWLPIRLGVITMLITIALLTAIGFYILHLPLSASVLLAAILAPTDPILASDVQVRDTSDRDRIRFSLTGEGGLNDGTAYPFVMLGLGMLAVPEAHAYTHSRVLLAVLWESLLGFGSGWLLGSWIGQLVLYLRRNFRMALGMEEFLTLGMIALSYGISQLIHSNGFIAVFATGLAVRRIEYTSSGAEQPGDVIGPVAAGDESDVATDPHKAPAYMTETVLGFNQQLEHIAEFIMVLLLGAILSSTGLCWDGVMVALLLFAIVRPIAVAGAVQSSSATKLQRRLMAWFGIRGVGSLYYLMFALQYTWPRELATRLTSIVLTVVAMSILLHGISSTPLMELYGRHRRISVIRHPDDH